MSETTTTTPGEAVDLGGIDPHVYHRRYAILATMCLSLVLIVATVSSVNVAIPSLAQSDLNPSDTQILWIVDAYALVFAALLLPAGALGDRFGRKGALLIGLVIFAVASALCAVMNTPNALIAMPRRHGHRGGTDHAGDPQPAAVVRSRRTSGPRPSPSWAGFAGAGGAIGPLMGGFLLEHFWYGSVFFVAAPIAMVAFVAQRRPGAALEGGRRRGARPVRRCCCRSLGSPALLFAIIEGPERGWTDALVARRVRRSPWWACSASCSTSGAPRTRCSTCSFFAIPRFAMGSLGITFTFFAMFSMFFVLTQYLQYVQGYSPLEAGVRGLPFAFTMIIVSPRSRRPGREARRAQGGAAAGMCTLVVGLLLLSLIAGRHQLLVRRADAGGDGRRRRLGDAVAQQRHRAVRADAQGRRRLGGERHHPRGGRRDRHRPHRQRAHQHLPRPRRRRRSSRCRPSCIEWPRDNIGKALAVADRAAESMGPEAAASCGWRCSSRSSTARTSRCGVAAGLVAVALGRGDRPAAGKEASVGCTQPT